MTLKKHLMRLLVVTTLISLAVQVFYFAFIFDERIEDARDTSFSVLNQTDILLDQVFLQVQQVGQSVSNSEDFQKYLLYKNGDTSEKLADQIGRISYLRNFLRGLVTSNDIIDDIIIADLRDGLISYSSRFTYSNYKYLQDAYALNELEGSVYLSQPFLGRSAALQSCAVVYVLPIRHTTGMFSQRNNLLGYCIILVRQSTLQSIVDHITINSSYTAIADHQGNVIVENTAPDSSGTVFPPVSDMIGTASAISGEAIHPINFNQTKFYTSIHQNDQIGWYTINLFPESILYENAETLVHMALLLALFNLMCVFLIGGGMVRTIYRQIKSIIKSLKCVSETKGKHRLPHSSQQEFDQISTAVNSMLDDLEQANQQILHIQNQLYENELLQKKSELKALQSQINPHFLFNTLECIRSIAVLRGMQEISTLTSSMANIFRYSISGGIESTVNEECDCVLDYFHILSIRHPDRFSMKLMVDPELYSYRMLKMCLQPLIENTVKHALEATETAIEIELRAQRINDCLYLTFTDSGSGMPQERLLAVQRMLEEGDATQAQDSQRSSIGLNNINQRIKLYYGPEYGLSITSIPSQGTTVSITLPLL